MDRVFEFFRPTTTSSLHLFFFVVDIPSDRAKPGTCTRGIAYQVHVGIFGTSRHHNSCYATPLWVLVATEADMQRLS